LNADVLELIDTRATNKVVSKRIDSPSRAWIKVRNPASIAVQRERSAIWNRRASGSARR
jgi:hypothetical protein